MPKSTHIADDDIDTGELENSPFPRGVLIGAGALITAAMLAAYTARTTDVGATRLQPAAAIESRDLRFSDLADGSVAVRDVRLDRDIKILSPTSNGFVKVVLRDLALGRRQLGIGSEPPFRLSRLIDGQAILTDTATGRIVTLTAFGAGNAEAFTHLLSLEKE